MPRAGATCPSTRAKALTGCGTRRGSKRWPCRNSNTHRSGRKRTKYTPELLRDRLSLRSRRLPAVQVGTLHQFDPTHTMRRISAMTRLQLNAVVAAITPALTAPGHRATTGSAKDDSIRACSAAMLDAGSTTNAREIGAGRGSAEGRRWDFVGCGRDMDSPFMLSMRFFR